VCVLSFIVPQKLCFPLHSLVCRRPACTLSFTNTTVIHKRFYQHRIPDLFIGCFTFSLGNCHCPITTNIVSLEADMHNTLPYPDAILWYCWCLYLAGRKHSRLQLGTILKLPELCDCYRVHLYLKCAQIKMVNVMCGHSGCVRRCNIAWKCLHSWWTNFIIVVLILLSYFSIVLQKLYNS
jgi:hypothetical protein